MNPAYIGQRNDILGLVPSGAKRVLDVGCSNGAFGAQIKESTGAVISGIELCVDMAEEATSKLDHVYQGAVEDVLQSGALDEQKFDVIICADVLEHLVDPWTVLEKLKSLLSEDGSIVVSIPNIRHFSTLFSVIFLGYWPYRDRGIHDRTHLRFFTLRNIKELFSTSGLLIQDVHVNYRLVESPHKINRFSKFFAWPGIRGFLAFQYLVRATR